MSKTLKKCRNQKHYRKKKECFFGGLSVAWIWQKNNWALIQVNKSIQSEMQREKNSNWKKKRNIQNNFKSCEMIERKERVKRGNREEEIFEKK